MTVGLPTGTRAPDFDLPSLSGGHLALSDLRGRDVLLIFVQPDCAFSRALLPAIAGLLPDPPERQPVPVVIAFGGVEDVRGMAQAAGLRCLVLAQRAREINTAYEMPDTPSACRIDAGGRIRGDCARGAAAVLRLAGMTPAARWDSRTTPVPTSDQMVRQHLEAQKLAGTLVPLNPDFLLQLPASKEFPLVSVVLCTRDRPRLLALALECYQHQNYPTRELIVVDSGMRFPADERAISAAGGRLLRLPGEMPLGAKLNRGVEATRGSLCHKWDDDDWYAPRFLHALVTARLHAAASPDDSALAYLREPCWFDLEAWSVRDPQRDPALPLPCGATLLFGRRDWEKHAFREIQRGEDFWFIADVLASGAAAVPVEPNDLFIYLRHPHLLDERGHTWTRGVENHTVEDLLRLISSRARDPSEVFPDWALAVYRDLRSSAMAR